ncbi:anosmin-1-like [Discoglossus pictus]
MQPCMGQWDTKRTQCERKCEKRHECVTSCEFLRSAQELKQGNCPSPHRAAGFAAACVMSCSADKECPGTKKCCSNGCGFTCQAPANMYKGVPLKPQNDLTFIEQSNRSLEVSWRSKFNVSAEPTLYILQRRWNYGIHPSEEGSTPWMVVAVTAADHAILRDIRPNRWYQFRVAAINVHGTQGFSLPSKHFHSPRDPLPPAAPSNVRPSNLTIARDGTVSVHISWTTPQEQDLEIHHYRVSWDNSTTGRKANWRLTQGVSTEIWLVGLLPNTDYLVQVQAVSYWGQKCLKSARSRLHFNTAQSGLRERNELPKSYKPEHRSTLQVSLPYYNNNQVQVKMSWKVLLENHKDPNIFLVKWKPVWCLNNDTANEEKAVVKGSQFVITGLLLACKYKVTVRPFTSHRPAAEEVTYVKTPKCNNIKTKGLKETFCTRQGRHLLSKKGILKPRKLTADFQSVNGSMRGEFHWQGLQRGSLHSIMGFVFSWAKIAPTTALNTAVYSTQTLPATHPYIVIEGLKASTLYHIKIQVITITGQEPVTEEFFQTPRTGS